MVFPKGNETEKELSVYISAMVPFVSAHVQFAIAIPAVGTNPEIVKGIKQNTKNSFAFSNPPDSSSSSIWTFFLDAEHTFVPDEVDWGFTHFVNLDLLYPFSINGYAS